MHISDEWITLSTDYSSNGLLTRRAVQQCPVQSGRSPCLLQIPLHRDSEEVCSESNKATRALHLFCGVARALTEPVWHPAACKGLQLVEGSVQNHRTDLRIAHGSPGGSKAT